MYRFKKLTPVAVSALAVASEIMPFINDKHDVNGIVHAVYKLLNKTNTAYIQNNDNKIEYSTEIQKNIKLTIEMKVIDN